MARIYSYRKVTDKYTIYLLREADAQGDGARITDLCTIDGITYVSVPDGVKLLEQPEQVAETLQEVELTGELRERIRAASPHVRLINERMKNNIVLDKNLHHVKASDEECETWRQGELAKLGLL